MSLKSPTSVLLQGARFALASLAMLQFSVLGLSRIVHKLTRRREPVRPSNT
jgi:hypothetical protein